MLAEIEGIELIECLTSVDAELAKCLVEGPLRAGRLRGQDTRPAAALAECALALIANGNLAGQPLIGRLRAKS